jgi:prefoldin subunit 5
LQRETDKILHNLETQIKALKQERDDLQKNFNQKTAENNQTIHELQTKVQEQEKQIFFKNQEEQEKITDYRI